MTKREQGLMLHLPWREAVAEFERTYLHTQLCRTGFNVARAAQNSGIDRGYFHRKAVKLGIPTNTLRPRE